MFFPFCFKVLQSYCLQNSKKGAGEGNLEISEMQCVIKKIANLFEEMTA